MEFLYFLSIFQLLLIVICHYLSNLWKYGNVKVKEKLF